MTPELVPSKTLQRAAHAERERLARAIARNEDRQSELKAELDALADEERELKERDQLLRSVAGPSASPGSPTVNGVLRGAQIREEAARIFFRRHGAGEARHYRHWFDLLIEHGIEISGRDPVATLLTNLNRSPVVVRGSDPGTYAIDFEAPARLSSELNELHAEFADLARVIEQSPTPEDALVERRAELLSEIRRVERYQAEAARVLDEDSGGKLAEAA